MEEGYFADAQAVIAYYMKVPPVLELEVSNMAVPGGLLVNFKADDFLIGSSEINQGQSPRDVAEIVGRNLYEAVHPGVRIGKKMREKWLEDRNLPSGRVCYLTKWTEEALKNIKLLQNVVGYCSGEFYAHYLTTVVEREAFDIEEFTNVLAPK